MTVAVYIRSTVLTVTTEFAIIVLTVLTLTQKTRDIWAGLITFANANLPDEEATCALAKAVYGAMLPSTREAAKAGWQKYQEGERRGLIGLIEHPDATYGDFSDPAWLPSLVGYLNGKDEPFPGDAEPTSAFSLINQQALKLQPKIRILLRYFCEAPKFDIQNPLVLEACDFLWAHETHARLIKIPPQEREFIDKSRTSFKRRTGRKRLYPYMNARWYNCMVDPICEFFNNQLEEYYAGNTAQLVPVVICSRAGCDKFVMPQRIGRRMYCDGCKDKHHNSEYKELRRDQKWLYRLLAEGKGDKTLLRTKMKQAGIRNRFDGLKKKKQFQKLIEKVESLTS